MQKQQQVRQQVPQHRIKTTQRIAYVTIFASTPCTQQNTQLGSIKHVLQMEGGFYTLNLNS